jgi:hypothetical protein
MVFPSRVANYEEDRTGNLDTIQWLVSAKVSKSPTDSSSNCQPNYVTFRKAPMIQLRAINLLLRTI